jgi:hypothetical protein
VVISRTRTRTLLRFTRVGCLAGLIALSACSRNGAPAPGEEATLQELNRALMTWGMMDLGPAPSTVEQLTNSPALKGKRLPTLPPGKKLTIDFTRREVVVVDQ